MTRAVAVTGGSGKLGSAVVSALSAAGWTVFNFDQVAPRRPQSASFTKIDFTDYGQTVEAFTGIDELHGGVDAVVHLAAIPGANYTSMSVTFANNMVGSYNVFAAAELAGVTNLVWASSETLMGYPFHTAPQWLPLDEDYPVQTNVTYAVVKHLEEELARRMCAANPRLKMLGLRFSGVMADSDYADLVTMQSDPDSRAWGLWSYIDASDGAEAVRLALDLDVTGMDTFVIANPDTLMTTPTRDLLDARFPGHTIEFRAPYSGQESVLSIDKARRTLGFTPTNGWRDRKGI